MTAVSYFIIIYFICNCLLTMHSLTLGPIKKLLDETVETEEPCCECLEHCFNYNTRRPVKYNKNKNYKEAK